jgi:serine/threonine protein kinase
MEFNAMNKLNHPNIVKAYCKFEDQYHYFILM